MLPKMLKMTLGLYIDTFCIDGQQICFYILYDMGSNGIKEQQKEAGLELQRHLF